MKSGKLDEELSRMSKVADHIGPGSILLLNESFSATNEREGSEIDPTDRPGNAGGRHKGLLRHASL